MVESDSISVASTVSTINAINPGLQIDDAKVSFPVLISLFSTIIFYTHIYDLNHYNMSPLKYNPMLRLIERDLANVSILPNRVDPKGRKRE